ncbi:MAG TPA: alpha/beta hydrolase [Verrucomicrobiales bacterium]|nr:alpha/beta hydrolase [Verrucomicrobiales bacterium]
MSKGFKWMSDREQLLIKSARKLVYKTPEEGAELSIYLFFPKDVKEGPGRPVLLFFNSGAWDRGNITQFAPHALYYVERGAVCGLVEYRNSSSHPGSCPTQSLQDGRSAIRFIRLHAESLHIDRTRLVAVGAGAGANIAGGAAMRAPLSESGVDKNQPDFQPNAVVLLSAIIDVSKGSYGFDQFASASEARLASLTSHIDSGLPPMLLVHGTADRLISHEDVAEFAAKMERRKNPCEYVEFEGRDQHFFNLNVDPLSYEACLGVMDDFLDRHGILKKDENHKGPHLISWREGDY